MTKFCSLSNRQQSQVSKILVDTQIDIPTEVSVPCFTSSQCNGLVYLSCGISDLTSDYLFSISIDAIDQNVTQNHTKANLLFQSQAPVVFGSDMIGINVFTIIYPKNLTGFIVFSKESWHVLILEDEERELPENCYAPESEIGHPILCQIPVPKSHSLEYVSMMNNSLWMHTSYDNEIHKQVIDMCVVMLDCFGCISVTEANASKCQWDGEKCINSPKKYPKTLDDCVFIDELDFQKNNYFFNFNLTVKVTGVRLFKGIMKITLEKVSGSISPTEIKHNAAIFKLYPEDVEAIKSNLSQNFLVIQHLFFSRTLRIPLDKKKPPGSSTVLWIIVLGILIPSMVVFLIFWNQQRLRSSLSKESGKSLPSPITKKGDN